MSGTLKRFGLFTVGQLLLQAIGIITFPIFARIISQEGFGLLGVLQPIKNLSSNLFRLGVHQSFLQQYKEYNSNEKNQYLSTLLVIPILWSIIWVVIIYTIYMVTDYNLFKNIKSIYPLIVIMIVAALEVPSAVIISFYRITGKAKSFISIVSIDVVLTTILSLGLIIFWGMDAIGKLYGIIIAKSIVLSVILLRHKVSIFSIKLKYWFKAASFGGPLAFSWWIGAMSWVFIMKMLNDYCTLDEIGVFYISRNIGFIFPLYIIDAINISYVPFIYNNSNAINKITKYNSIIIVTYLGISLLSLIFIKYIILVFVSGKYIGAISLIRIFLVASFVSVASILPRYRIYSLGRTKLISIIDVIINGFIVVIIGISIKHYGLISVPLTMIIAEVFRFFILKDISNLKFVELISLKELSSLISHSSK